MHRLILLAVALAATLAGCSSGPTIDASAPTVSSTTTASPWRRTRKPQANTPLTCGFAVPNDLQ